MLDREVLRQRARAVDARRVVRHGLEVGMRADRCSADPSRRRRAAKPTRDSASTSRSISSKTKPVKRALISAAFMTGDSTRRRRATRPGRRRSGRSRARRPDRRCPGTASSKRVAQRPIWLTMCESLPPMPPVAVAPRRSARASLVLARAAAAVQRLDDLDALDRPARLVVGAQPDASAGPGGTARRRRRSASRAASTSAERVVDAREVEGGAQVVVDAEDEHVAVVGLDLARPSGSAGRSWSSRAR